MAWAALVASASVPACSGSVKGGDSGISIADDTGDVIVVLGPNGDVTASFVERHSVVTSAESPGGTGASVNDGTRDCTADAFVIADGASSSTNGNLSYSDVSAGIVTVTGGLTPVTLMPGASSTEASGIDYAPASASGLPAGGAVTITATGDTVPPFSVECRSPAPSPGCNRRHSPPGRSTRPRICRSLGLAGPKGR